MFRLLVKSNSFSPKHFVGERCGFSSISSESIHLLHPRTFQTCDRFLNFCFRICEQLAGRRLFDELPEIRSCFSKTCKVIHAQSLTLGFWSKRSVGNAILDLHAKCGDVFTVSRVFDTLEARNITSWNSMLSMHSKLENFEVMLRCFKLLCISGIKTDEFTCSMAISCLSKLNDIAGGRIVHCLILKMGFESSVHCQGSLVNMYSKGMKLRDAQKVFDVASGFGNVLYTSMITGYIRVGSPLESIKMYEKMKNTGYVPDQVAVVAVLNAYVKLGRFDEAFQLFSTISKQNIVAWNVMISGHAQKGFEIEAIKLYQDMRMYNIKSTRSTFGSTLSAIANLSALHYGLIVHAEAIKQGLHSNPYVGSSLINMYGKNKKMEAAKEIFVDVDEQNIVMWNAMIGAYSQNGDVLEAIEWFCKMKRAGLQPDEFTYTSILSVYACLKNLESGRQLHSVIIKRRIFENLFVGNALVDMYAKCGMLEEARNIFERMKKRDSISWNAIIVGYVQEQEEVEAFCMFSRMIALGIMPSEISISSILSSFANANKLDLGTQIHCLSIKCGLETSLYTGCSLISMYCKCGFIDYANKIFLVMPEKNLVSMNAIIAGYASHRLENAVLLFEEMLDVGITPSDITYTSLLDSCNNPEVLHLGMELHCRILKSGLQYDDEFLGVSLLGMYMNCQKKPEAIALFSEFSNPSSVVMWTSIISGLVHNDYSEDGFRYFQKMHKNNVLPDQATFVTVLKASASLSSLKCGRQVHSLIFHTGFDLDEITCSSIVDMYAKCGDISSSQIVFDEVRTKSSVCFWNSMIVGYAKNGFADDALRIFGQMEDSNIIPDHVTFLGALTACSHAGKVHEGRAIFNRMVNWYQIQPTIDHCASMVDILGRCGFLSEADEFIANYGCSSNVKICASMLGACAMHGDDFRGQRAAEKLLELEPHNSSAYVLLSNLHAASQKWSEVKILRKEMRDRGLKKLPGCSWIDIGRQTSLFSAGDKSPGASDALQQVVKELMLHANDVYYNVLVNHVSQLTE